jgi:MATE family multidrug resistance protein
VNIVARGVLRGTGDVRFPAWTGVLSAWLLTPPLTWWLGGRLGWGALGGWLGMCAEVVVGALILWTRLERSGWRPSAERARAEMRARAAAVVPLPARADVVAPSGG